MKLKKILIIIISIILMSIPLDVFGWIVNDTYLACNKLNVCISEIMKISAFCVVISYITITIQYLRYSEHKAKEKSKNILIWLIIAIIQTSILILGSLLVKEIGIEEYWYSTRKIYQANEIRGFISSFMRMTALWSVLAYIIFGITYFIKSKKERNQKIKNLIKWQIIVSVILAITLTIAKIL